MTVREKQVAARRGRILDAAGALIRATGGTDFTMLEVAERAEVSPATPYNLFASKNGLLYALLDRSLDEVLRGAMTFSAASPLEHPLEAADIAADLFARDPVFYRPLFLVLLGGDLPGRGHAPRSGARIVVSTKVATAPARRTSDTPAIRSNISMLTGMTTIESAAIATSSPMV